MIHYSEDRKYEFRRSTIEGQLRMYEQHPDRSERSATLWHAWSQNKRWLMRLLELTIASFPTYSVHNASHAEAVLYNIERVLGEKRIQDLSATDCFAILHTVYVHDIGMAIMASDRDRIVKSDDFIDLVEELALGADVDLKKAAEFLKKDCYRDEKKTECDYEGEEYYHNKQKLYSDKLNTYYAVIHLLAEFQRKEHGSAAASRIRTWIEDGDKLQSEFAMSGIPMRIFFRIAECASLHTDWEFRHILDLPKEENGYESDMLHPRFVAVLLQIGDALDIDNDRFHPFAQAFMGKLPMQSQIHYDKHLAIRTLKITPEEIVVEADCKTRDTLRLVRNECDVLEMFLKSSSYYWSQIAPTGFSGALPSLRPPKLLLNGQIIPLDLAMMRFQISEKKAFSLLQGENIYSGYFPFVRELVQNAIDTTKIQCYQDYLTSSKRRYKTISNTDEILSIADFLSIINPLEYPIELEIKCAREEASGEWILTDFDKLPEEDDESGNYGIIFTIRDYGTGIDRETLRAISNVGTSYKKRKKLIKKMPNWLRPTGEFGIGLQSVFLVNDKFYCETYVRSGERYKIEFRTGATGEKGYINVEPKNPEKESMAYGTEFQIFINHNKKRVRDAITDAWLGYDPFEQGYEKDRLKREIIQLSSQILLDIDKQLEDMLFPVYAHTDFKMEEKLVNKMSKIVFDDSQQREKFCPEKLKERVCWMYECNEFVQDGSKRQFAIKNGICMVDLDNMKIHLWLEDISVSAQIGVNRIISNILEENRELCRISFKGILTEYQEITNDFELLESIDLFGRHSEKSILHLSRNGFTEAGEEYIHETVIPKVLEALYDALKSMAEINYGCNEKGGGLSDVAEEKFEAALEKALQRNKSDLKWKRQLLGYSLFYHFYMLERDKADLPYESSKSARLTKEWEKVLEAICRLAKHYREKLIHAGITDVINNLEIMEVRVNWKNGSCLELGSKHISIADFFHRKKYFWALSDRRHSGDAWANYLLQVDRSVDRAEKIVSDSWAETALEDMKRNMEEKVASAQGKLIQWIMKLVPVTCNFSDFSGNTRIHILSGKPSGSIIYNQNAKYMLLRRMAERNTRRNARRMASYVWYGYELLAVPTVQEDVCLICENYVYANRNKMFLPCLGETAGKLIALVENETDAGEESMKKIEKLEKVENLLENCLVLDGSYYKANEERRKCMEDARWAFGRSVRKSISEEAFLNRVQTYYDTLLKREAKRMKCPEADCMLALPKETDLETLRDEVYKGIMEMIGEKSEEGFDKLNNLENISEFLLGKIQKVCFNCYIWLEHWEMWKSEYIGEYVKHIRRDEWENAQPGKNLIEWTSKVGKADADAVKEQYDMLWDEIEVIVTERKARQIRLEKQFRNYDQISDIHKCVKSEEKG